ncbi:cbb3-type cytochrome c oxidase subunit 3 [Aestuariivirga sp.]|jgi:cytochrome c oxidase cbb3-type subunit 4|uniref:cbb3-type cytochrome c oxidase subunit 3 n=1 Tax=Aestuariivirga sp. TaxID=2650926 RepID=UPI0037846FB9
MGHYDTLRHFADSWGLLAMFVFFIAMVLFVFRRGSKARYEEAAQIPLRNGSEDQDQ